MKPRKATYIAHRWVGLIISIQLLAWSVGGLVFSLLDIDDVRGHTDSQMLSYPINKDALPPILQQATAQLGDQKIASVNLIDRGLGPFWEVRDIEGELISRLDITGATTEHITQKQAETLALNDFLHDTTVKNIELIESDPPSEYRGGPLPAYRVDLKHPKNPHIYIDAQTGRINARRNDTWRTFDFFWMLHIMDYKDRDNFNHPLLIIASVFAIAISATGIILWGWRYIPKIFGKRKRKPQPKHQP